MRAVVITKYGDPDVLSVIDVEQPQPNEHEICVKVRATSLNRADLMQRMGFYPDPFPGAHEIPGLEFAGTVVTCGARVTNWNIGDAVMGIVSGGAYAEYLVVHEQQAMRVPTRVGLDDAAAIPEVFITAWDALVCQGNLQRGDWALVHAGASGVGTAAIQICKAIGANVVVTCSANKRDACLALGADMAVDYHVDDFVEICQRITAGKGINVVLDVIGGEYLNRNVSALATKGTIVQVGLMGGGSTPFNIAALMPKRARLIGTVLRPRSLEEKIVATQRFINEMLPMFETGKLRPVIDSRYSLENISAAHRYMETNASTGKIVINV
ncbi:MAG: NAD(P)H-quinone oxidoreductase [Acidimicrobiaceae bacterium]|nr:NAD(P)H-quinone oxidoreductase [Acidimicrobiaceae bacterium]